jgi:RNA polymerase sigma-70 factor (ECF subfamily)
VLLPRSALLLCGLALLRAWRTRRRGRRALIENTALMSEAELDALMARLADGDRSAFDPLYRELRPRALRAARRVLAPDVADDVAQGALERVFFRAGEFASGRACLPWFYGIVANEVRGTRRKRAHAPLIVEPAADVPSADEAIARRELERALDRAITELDGPSAEAIAALLGRAAPLTLAAPTVRKRLSRAYARLRTILGGSHG